MISPLQVTAMVVVSRLSLTLIFYGATRPVRHDVWWQSFPAALMTMGFAWLLSLLWRRFPDKSLVEIFQAVLGRTAGRALALVYSLIFLLVASLSLRLTGEVFVFAFLPRTPMVAIIGVVALLAIWAAQAGLEVIGRVCQLVFPVLITSILAIVVLLLKDINFQLLFPPQVLVTGPVPHLLDTVSVAARSVELLWVGLLVPNVAPRQFLRPVVMAELWLGAVWVFMGVAIYGTLGQDITSIHFPFLHAARMVSVADFLERVEGILLSGWLLGMFLRAGMLLWACAVSASAGLGLRNYRPLVAPLAALAVLHGLNGSDSMVELLYYLNPAILTPFLATFNLAIPMLVLVIAAVRGVRSRPAQGPA